MIKSLFISLCLFSNVCCMASDSDEPITIESMVKRAQGFEQTVQSMTKNPFGQKFAVLFLLMHLTPGQDMTNEEAQQCEQKLQNLEELYDKADETERKKLLETNFSDEIELNKKNLFVFMDRFLKD